MAKRTISKPIALSYGVVGDREPDVKLMGVLKGLAIGQDDPDENEIDSEFLDAPYNIIYDGKPVTITFELVNYDIEELPPLFGGFCANGEYISGKPSFTSEHSWRIDFQNGECGFVIYRGLTVGTLKKDEDGALGFSVTITSLLYMDASNENRLYCMADEAESDDAYVLSNVLIFPSGNDMATVEGREISLNGASVEENHLLVI